METIERNSNTVVLSSLSEFYAPVLSKGFAVKYVSEGTELYTLNQQQYHIGAGHYLLCNSTKEGHVEIESTKNVKGICINITPELMQEAVASLQRPDTAFPDSELGSFFSTTHFLENKYDADKTILGKTLTEMSKSAHHEQFDEDSFTIEFFYSLAEKIIADQLPVFKQLQSLPGIKYATKKDLYKRITRGKEVIDSSFSSSLSVEMMAKEAYMSEYHFFRLFKKMYSISPHQYMLRKRLENGKVLLQQQVPVSAAALECGFSDIYSFSKAFKNQFGITPSSLLKK